MKTLFLKTKKIIQNVLSTLISCITPTLPIMIGVGMIKVLLIILGPLVTGILSESSSTYIVLSFVADAGYYFMPIYAAVSAASAASLQVYIPAS